MPERSWIAKKRHFIPLALLAVGIIVAIVAYVSPWPSAMLLAREGDAVRFAHPNRLAACIH